MQKLKNVFQASFVILWLQLYRVGMDTYYIPSLLYFHNRKCVCSVKIHFTYFLFLFHFSLSIMPSYGARGLGERRFQMGEAGVGEEKGKVSLLQLSPFFASTFPLFPEKRLILRLFSLLH